MSIEKNYISAIICAKNEEKNIYDVLQETRLYVDEILVIDGHSTDNTRTVAESVGARVVAEKGKGKGAAIRTGIGEASGDVIVFLDADGSHDPRDIPRLIEPIINNTYDHVTGSRMLGGSDELHGDLGKFMRMVGSDIITLGINYRFNVRLTDSQNGFRAIRTSVAKALSLKENITTIEQEMIIKTLQLGYRMGEVSTHEYARKSGVSHINVGRASFRYVYSWLKYLMFK